MTESRVRSRPFLIALATLLSIIALGELYALYLQYQNNRYFRQYVSDNFTGVLVQALGLVVLGIVAAYLSYLFNKARPTSRAGRFSRKVFSFSPLIAGLIALILWFAALSQIVRGSTLYFEVYIVIVLLLISLGMMANDRLTFRMAIRNFTRRKTSMAIVIAGLMIGTAMISGSLVTQDTLTELFTRGAYFGYGYADEVVFAPNPTTGYQFFPVHVAQQLYQGITSNPSASQYLRGVTPEILSTISVNDTTKNIVQSPVLLIGTFNNATELLGDFHSINGGAVIGPSLADNEAILNDRAAKDLNATAGDSLTVFSPSNATFEIPLKLVGIAVSDSRTYFGAGENIFVTMNTAQALDHQPGLANYIAITNTGGLRPSIQHTSVVGLAANQTLNG